MSNVDQALRSFFPSWPGSRERSAAVDLLLRQVIHGLRPTREVGVLKKASLPLIEKPRLFVNLVNGDIWPHGPDASRGKCMSDFRCPCLRPVAPQEALCGLIGQVLAAVAKRLTHQRRVEELKHLWSG